MQKDWGGIVLIGPVTDFLLPTPGFELMTSRSLVLHCTTAPLQHLVFISDNFRYLTLVQRDWWWYCSDWILWDIFLLACIRIWTRDIWISSPALYHWTTLILWFSPLTISQVFNSGAEGLVVVLFWLDPLRDFLVAHNGVWTGCHLHL